MADFNIDDLVSEVTAGQETTTQNVTVSSGQAAEATSKSGIQS